MSGFGSDSFRMGGGFVMGIGRYDYDPHERWRSWLRTLKVVAYAAFVVSVGLFSYQFAVERGKTREAARDEVVNTLNRQIADLQALATQNQQTARSAEAHVKDLEKRLAAEVPSGDKAKLYQQLVDRLNSGVTAERLSLVLAHTHMPTNCAAMDGKRITVNTPRSRSGPKATGFANGLVLISAEGESSREKASGSEPAFDPAQPVRIKVIVSATGKETLLNGVLPQRTSLVANGHEVRLAFSVGNRSAIEATAESCDFP